MSNENGKTMYKHKVVVDDNISLELKIPEVISAIELKALTTKANKIFNISDVMMMPSNTTPVKQRRRKGKGSHYTEAQKAFIINKKFKENLPTDQIAEEYNKRFEISKTVEQIKSAAYNYRRINHPEYVKIMQGGNE